MSSPPASAAAVDVAGWLARRFGAPVTTEEPLTPIGGGFDADIYAARFGGRGLPDEHRKPLIVRVLPQAERQPQADREAAVQHFLATAGYPVPRMLHVVPAGELCDGPVQLMERVPGTTMVAAMTSRPWRFRPLATRLGELHARLHGTPTTGWPFPEEAEPADTSFADRRLGLPRRVVADGGAGSEELAAALARVERLVPELSAGSPRAVCHGDFHPLNVMVDGERTTVIDWTDAALGDPHGDVARLRVLLEVTPVAATNRAEAAVVGITAEPLRRRHLEGYRRAGGHLDEARIERWLPVHLVHDWARALASGSERMNPAVVPWIQRRLATLLAP